MGGWVWRGDGLAGKQTRRNSKLGRRESSRVSRRVRVRVVRRCLGMGRNAVMAGGGGVELEGGFAGELSWVDIVKVGGWVWGLRRKVSSR